MDDLLTRSLQGVFKTASPAEREKLYAAVKAAIRTGDMELAHLALLELVRVDHENPEYWLLLAWTSPDRQSAEIFFTRLVIRYPNHPMAKGKVPWSGKVWGQLEPEDEPVSEVDVETAAEIASITGNNVEGAAAQADEKAPKTAHPVPPGAEPKVVSVSVSQAGRKEEGIAAFAEPLQIDDPQEDKNAAAAPAAWGGVPVSHREAQWLAGVVPGVGRAGGEDDVRGAVLPQTESTEEESAAAPEAAPEAWGRSATSEWGASAWTKASRAEHLQMDSVQGNEMAAARLEQGAARSQVGSVLGGLLEKIRQLNFTTVLVLYMAGITLAEALTTFISPYLGLVIHGILLVLILIHSAVRTGNKEQRFLLALGMAPLIRLMSLSMPLLQFDYIYWYMIIGIPLLVAAWVVYRLSGYKAKQIGLSWGKLLPAQLAIGLSGIWLGFFEYLILKPEPLVESFTLGSIWLPALILLVFTGFLEELIFRGLMQRASLNTLKKHGLVYISLLFAVLHIGYKSWVDLVFVFLVGFAFSIVVERTRSLIGVTVAHGLTNISLFLIFPFLVGAQFSLPDFLPPPAEPILGPAMWSGSLELTPRPTRTPLPTITNTPMLAAPTDTVDAAALPGVVTTPTPVSSPTSTPTPTASLVPTLRYTATPWVVYSATPTRTPTYTATYSATSTLPASSTPTATLVPSPTATETLVPTDVLPEEPTPVPTDSLPVEPTISP